MLGRVASEVTDRCRQAYCKITFREFQTNNFEIISYFLPEIISPHGDAMGFINNDPQ
jgi:hypothetical protein